MESSSVESTTIEPEEINKPVIVICEGGESAFFKALLIARDIAGIQVVKEAQGNTDFTKRLNALKASRAYVEKRLSDIILITDNDDNPTKSFQKIRRQINRSGDFPVPAKPYERTHNDSPPAVTVVMLPAINVKGCFEGFLLTVYAAKYKKVMTGMLEFIKCTPATKWSPSKKDKMLMQCMIAAVCKDDPCSSLRLLWTKKRKQTPLLKHIALKPIVKFLSSFSKSTT